MPLLNFTVVRGRTPEQIHQLLDAKDLIVSITENGDADWSFGAGRAQFVTGELA